VGTHEAIGGNYVRDVVRDACVRVRKTLSGREQVYMSMRKRMNLPHVERKDRMHTSIYGICAWDVSIGECCEKIRKQEKSMST